MILLVAAFFRLWQLDSIPPGLFGDEATDGLDALDVLAGRGQVFFPGNYGREGLYIWIVALSLKLFGVTPLAMRLPSVVIGILTCPVAWWLAREWTGRAVDSEIDRLGDREPSYQSTNVPIYHSLIPLLAALYIATSYWHVNFSRFSQRTVLTPLAIGLAAAAFWRALNLGRTRWFVAAGAFMGLALHTYSVGRFLPVFMACFLVLQWLVTPKPRPGEPERRILARHWRDILLMFLVAAVIFAPLGVYFLMHPGTFMMRARAVATYAGGGPLESLKVIGRAALANLAQYVVPGAGDRAQFHNLPGRPIFEPLTALLAIVGVLVCLRRWRQPASLFLLAWLVVLTAPAALATDRFPTLPRVLGMIPGVYLFPAVGLSAVVRMIAQVGRMERGSEGNEGNEGTEGTAATMRKAPLPRCALSPRHPVTVSPCHPVTLSPCHPVTLSLVMTVALLVHAGVTYRDYFRVWGPAPATFDAFEGDITSAWQWLETHEPAGHVYLSSDIYRHPTFMLLAERATVQTYFQHRNPNLSWFDARGALPLPPAGERATYLIAASSQPAGPAAAFLAYHSVEQDLLLAPDGTPALTAFGLPANADPRVFGATGNIAAAFTERLRLTAAAWRAGPDGLPVLQLLWRTAGPDQENPAGYRLEIAAGDWQTGVPFDAFRPPEWVPDGRFVTWHRLETPGDPPYQLRLRLIDVRDGEPVISPAAPDGWHAVIVSQ